MLMLALRRRGMGDAQQIAAPPDIGIDPRSLGITPEFFRINAMASPITLPARAGTFGALLERYKTPVIAGSVALFIFAFFGGAHR